MSTVLYKIGGISSKDDNITTESGNVKLGTDGTIPVIFPSFSTPSGTDTGLIVYDSTTNSMKYRDNSAFQNFSSGGGGTGWVYFSTTNLTQNDGLDIYTGNLDTNNAVRIVCWGIPNASGSTLFVSLNTGATSDINYGIREFNIATSNPPTTDAFRFTTATVDQPVMYDIQIHKTTGNNMVINATLYDATNTDVYWLQGYSTLGTVNDINVRIGGASPSWKTGYATCYTLATS